VWSSAVSQLLELSRDTGARLHLLHTHAGASLRLLRRAKEDGHHVTVGIDPKYFHLTARDLAEQRGVPLLPGSGLLADAAQARAEALRIGLVERVVPHDRLMESARTMAASIASKGPLAVTYAKALLNLAENVPLDQGCAAEAEAFGACFSTHDQKEGMAAFVEKRKPDFKGA